MMSELLRGLFLGLVYIYRVFSGALSFLTQSVGVPYQCKFPITCSEFAQEQLKNEAQLSKALIRIAQRLLSCGPWAK